MAFSLLDQVMGYRGSSISCAYDYNIGINGKCLGTSVLVNGSGVTSPERGG